ncbi:hypothetical protein OS493_031258 [Desmophyllum pertusum]|uniref:Uncharacterized protein n=1 Tax=Desmophyllum pertusum TaxID=174260 RepID=A0A9W9Z8P7_9CNID|nr:hypothetical protein OS493_031258 [Desmophyllum pertusum]
MAADLKRSAENMCSIELLVLYENDGLFIKYSDGTSLELSPCGSAFLHRQSAPSNSAMRQLTRFAVSSFRAKITEAVRIRNMFAATPYLCKELTDPQELKVGYQDVTQCCWPDQFTTDLITRLSDGSACVTSVDGLASLTLMPHRQAFIVKFLAEVKYSLPQASKPTTPLPKPPYQAHVVDTADVPGTGRFKAYSNGHINVVFSNRTILDIRNLTDDKENAPQNCWCQLVLPNGIVQHFRLTDVEQCRTYERYIQTALHWSEWVKATPSQRRTFYKDTIWDPEKRRAVNAEVEKIKRFNYIHDQQTVPNLAQRTLQDITKSRKEEDIEDDEDSVNIPDLPDRETTIKSVLEQTNKAIDDIDSLLTTLKCSPQNIH